MESWKTQPHWFIRLDRGEELVASLKYFALAQKITAGSIRGIGGVGPVTLAFYERETKKYDTKVFTEEYELLQWTTKRRMLKSKYFL